MELDDDTSALIADKDDETIQDDNERLLVLKEKKFRRRHYVIAFAVRSFLCGLEWSVFNPSVWFYLKPFGVNRAFLGVVMGAYTATSMVALVVAGRLYDVTRRTRWIVFATNIFEVFGNLIYSLNFSPYFPLAGRLTSGFGDGFFSVVYAEIGSVYPPAARLTTFALIEGGRILGYVAGPVTAFALEHVDFRLGKWHVTYGASPGFILSFVWLLMTGVMLFLVYDMYREESTSKNQPNEEIRHVTVREGFAEVMTCEPLVVMAVDLLFWGLQALVTASFSVFAVEVLGWNSTRINILYTSFGVLVAASLVSVMVFKVKSELTCLIVSSTLSSLVPVASLVLLTMRLHHKTATALLIAQCVWMPPFYAVGLITGRSLLTKLVCTQNQGFAQGVYNVGVSLAIIFGYVAGSVSVSHPYYFLPAIAAMFVAAPISLWLSRRRILARIKRVEEGNNESSTQ